MSKIIKLSSGIDASVKAAQEVLSNPGAVILVPTETVYGLVCNWFDGPAIERIYELKGRDRDKPFAAFVGDYRRVKELGAKLDGCPEKLAMRYCPGKITIIAPTEDGTTLGFRVPDHEFILALLKAGDYILASTSANASGQPNALTLEMALTGLHGDVDLAIDGGDLPADALASTVVLATQDTPKILRQGALNIEF